MITRNSERHCANAHDNIIRQRIATCQLAEKLTRQTRHDGNRRRNSQQCNIDCPLNDSCHLRCINYRFLAVGGFSSRRCSKRYRHLTDVDLPLPAC
jgi:hypothetical protein